MCHRGGARHRTQAICTQHRGNAAGPSVRLLLATALLGLPFTAAAPGEEPVPEYKLKAAFLYNFSLLVTWPEEVFEDEDTPFVVGVLGSSPFEDYLEHAFAHKQVDGREVALEVHESIHDALHCQILYVAQSERDQLDEVIEAFAGKPVFLVSDLEGFAEDGGIARFFIERGRLRFEINPVRAKDAGLELSSHLLRLARLVGERKEGSP